MKTTMIALALSLLSFLTPSYAEVPPDPSLFTRIRTSTESLPWAVVSGFESRHIGGHGELNTHNRGIGLRAEGGWVLGGYYNSYRHSSIYAGREFQWRLLGQGENGVNIGAVAGIVSGYRGGLHANGDHGLHIMALPELVAVSRYAELSLMYIPELTKTPATLALQVRVRWP